MRSDGLNVPQRIAEQVFAAMQQYAFGTRGRPRFKGANRPLHSLEATTNAANIIWKAGTGCIEFGDLTLPAKHNVSAGSVVGLDIDPSTVAVVGEDSASLVKFCNTVIQPWKETRRLVHRHPWVQGATRHGQVEACH